MRILIVNPHMKIGGISTSLYNLLFKLKEMEDRYKMDLLLFNPYVDDKFSDIKNITKIDSLFFIKLVYINFSQAKKHLRWYEFIAYLGIKFLEKIFSKNRLREAVLKHSALKYTYDVAISFSNDIPQNNVFLGSNFYVEKVVKAKQKIAWIHNDIDKLGMTSNYLLITYKNFDKIVNVSNSCKSRFEILAPGLTHKSYLFNNYIDSVSINKKSKEFNPYNKESDKLILVTVARIENRQKRIDRVIKIAHQLKEDKINFFWYVIGGGPDLEKNKIEKERLNLGDVLQFEGFQVNPYPFIKNADLFVLTSDYEAQGMVLSESLLLKTPVVTTNFEAAKEFVLHNENGFVCENNTEKLYRCIKQVLIEPGILEKLKNNQNQITGIKDSGDLFFSKFDELLYS